MLYPIIELTIDQPDTVYQIASGSLAVIGLTVDPGSAQTISMAQLANSQDFSLRAWISIKKDGQPIDSGVWASWVLSKRSDAFVLHDAAIAPPDGMRSVPVEPGSYWLNILNLVNSNNMFAFATVPVNSAT